MTDTIISTLMDYAASSACSSHAHSAESPRNKCKRCMLADSTIATLAVNVRNMRARATESEVRRGRAWYRRMARLCAGRAAQSNLTAENVGGIYAAFSINTCWSMNLRYSGRMLRNMRNGRDYADNIRTLGGNIGKAVACANGAAIGDVVADPNLLKIRSFAANCSGDFSHVTVDRWAMYIATGGAYKFVPDGDCYRMVAEAYRIIAAEYNETPADTQAITWCIVRDAGIAA